MDLNKLRYCQKIIIPSLTSLSEEIFDEIFGNPPPDTVAGALIEASLVSLLPEEEV